MTLYSPNDELVLQTWLKTYAATLGTLVATSLPAEIPNGFVTVRALPLGLAGVDISKRREAVCSADVWAPPAGVGSDKPRWPMAWNLYSRIFDALDNETQHFGVTLTPPPVGGDTHRSAIVWSVWATSTPRRIENDPSAYAHLTFDIAIVWAVLPS